MLIAVIALIAVVALLGGLNVAQHVALNASRANERASEQAAIAQGKLMIAAEVDRDRALARAVQSETERDMAVQGLRSAQAAANEARDQLAAKIEAKIRSGSAADAANALTELLAQPILPTREK